MRASNLCILPKLSLKDAKRPRPADIMCHQLVYIGPDVLAWRNSRVVTVSSQYLLCHGHWTFHLHSERHLQANEKATHGQGWRALRIKYTLPVQ